jgi:hypothetical protein
MANIKKCAYKSYDNKKCKNHIYNDNTFCGIHNIYESKVDINNILYCIDCKSIIIDYDSKEKCKNCNIMICKAITNKNTLCTYKAIDGDNYCMKHKSYKKWKDLTDAGKNICPNWIRGCWNEIESNNSTNYCKSCCNKNIIVPKNKKQLIEDCVEFNSLNTEFKMCIHCASILNNTMININDLCNYCDRMTKVNTDNYKEKDLYEIQYNNFLYNAQLRDIEFNLTYSEAISFFDKSCFYCNDKKDVMGIDRLNSRLNYNIKNCVPCCTKCNFMKNITDCNDFINMCHHITVYNNKDFIQDTTTYYELFQSGKRPSYTNYKKSANRRNIDFNLSRKEFMTIIMNPCTYCGVVNNTPIGSCAGGIDRKDSNKGYNEKNCVACCKTCNFMKGTLTCDDFLNQCNMITMNHDREKKNKIENEILHLFLNLGNTTYKRTKPSFLHSHDYYKNRIWFGTLEDLAKVKIELEFVENKDQKDIWNYYRYYVSSLQTFKINNFVGRVMLILVKDTVTRKYLGIMSLNSDILDLAERDRFIGWTKDDRIKNKKLNQIMNISTCVGLQPFAYNFNGGKLLTKLAFSKEVMDKFYDKYKEELLGLITTGLYGKSIQYDRLKEIKFIGYTSGNSMYKISPEVTKKCREYLQICHNKKTAKVSKLYIIADTLQKLGLPRDEFMRDNPKGIYFGYTYKNSKEILCSLEEKVIPTKFKSCQEIFDEWYNRWAKQRYHHLEETCLLKFINVIKSTDRVDKYRNELKNIIGEEEFKNILSENNHEYYDQNKDKIKLVNLEKYNNMKKAENKKVKNNIILDENTKVVKPDLPPNISLYRENNGKLYIQYNKIVDGIRQNTKHTITTADIQFELNKLISTVNRMFPNNKIDPYTIINADIWNKNNSISTFIKEITPITTIIKPTMPTNFSICSVNGTDYIQFCKKIDDKKLQYKTRINSYDLQSELNRYIDYLNTNYDMIQPKLVKADYNVDNTSGWKTTNNIIDHTMTDKKKVQREKANEYNAKKREILGEEQYKEIRRLKAKEYREKQNNKEIEL